MQCSTQTEQLIWPSAVCSRPEPQSSADCLCPRKVEASRARESPAGSLSETQRPGAAGGGGGGGSSVSEQSHSRNGQSSTTTKLIQTNMLDFFLRHNLNKHHPDASSVLTVWAVKLVLKVPLEEIIKRRISLTKVIFLPAGASDSRERSCRDSKAPKDKSGSLHLGTIQTVRPCTDHVQIRYRSGTDQVSMSPSAGGHQDMCLFVGSLYFSLSSICGWSSSLWSWPASITTVMWSTTYWYLQYFIRNVCTVWFWRGRTLISQ